LVVVEGMGMAACIPVREGASQSSRIVGNGEKLMRARKMKS
jgi:hypothetical protein